MTISHVLPVGDLLEHDETRQCLCRPKVMETADGDVVIVHHSYDGREYWDPTYDPEPPNG